MTPRRSVLLSLLLVVTGLPSAGAATLPAPVAVPPATIVAVDAAAQAARDGLEQRHAELGGRLAELRRRIAAFNAVYVGKEFEEASVEALAGAAEQAWLLQERDAYLAATLAFAAAVDALPIDRARRIASMHGQALALGWDATECDRLESALQALALDGDRSVTVQTIAATWQAITERGQDPALVAAAAAVGGPDSPGVGGQSFNDCTMFALANASGLPYGVVAARATTLIADGPWRPDADRVQAQQVIEQHGLDGYEVIMLAEAFGEAEVVASTDFAATLQAGSPILACVVTVAADGRDALHEVLLTRTFRHDEQTWFEMLDSNLAPPQRRYLSEGDLQIILQENGVAVRPQSGRSIDLLRTKDPE